MHWCLPQANATLSQKGVAILLFLCINVVRFGTSTAQQHALATCAWRCVALQEHWLWGKHDAGHTLPAQALFSSRSQVESSLRGSSLRMSRACSSSRWGGRGSCSWPAIASAASRAWTR